MVTKKIEMIIECPQCKGTGLYQGIGEGKGTAVVCHYCKGTGAYQYTYSYKTFTGRKKKDGVERVYLSGMGYTIGLGVIDYQNIGKIDMDKEGISYAEFLEGKFPKHIQQLACPLRADQGACHAIKGFVDKCEQLNGGWVSYITDCKMQSKKSQCWKRFEELKNDN